MADDTLPPVGATVTDGWGITWTCVSSSWTTDGFTRERLWESTTGLTRLVEHAKDTTALWRMQQERDGFKAEVARLREEMELRQRLYDTHPGPREEELAAFRALAVEAKADEATITQLDITLLQTAQTFRRIRARHERLAALAPKEASHE